MGEYMGTCLARSSLNSRIMATCYDSPTPEYDIDATAGVCTRDESFFGDTYVLPQAAGYGIVIGFGIFFSLVTGLILKANRRYGGVNVSSEYFNTAGRNVKTGLTASVIVSQWTWAATLLQSSNVAYQYGVSGPFWYASGATIQVLLFGMLAIQVKRYAPNAHTIVEIIDARWGANVAKVFTVFCFMANVIVSSMLVLGGAATVNALTGMSTTAAGFLIPIGVITYTMTGGLKATFLAGYIHTAIIFSILIIFIFIVYAGDESKGIGSADNVYNLLNRLSTATATECTGRLANKQNCGYVAKNEAGSYLTMLSEGGIIFGIINIAGNFGTVFVDQSYWQSAIAAKPSSSTKGYLLGGLVWFTIPFALATAMGLATVAMDLPVTSGDADDGLVPPAAAVHFFGKGGAMMITIMLFMAITSTGSAEQIAVSSLIAYDIYKKYINPKATGEQILKVSRVAILGFGLFMGSAVMPVAFVLTWKNASATGAIAGAIVGQVCAMITWIVCSTFERDADGKHGTVDLDTLGGNYPMLAGNVMAIGMSGIVCAVISMMNPQNFDFNTLKDGIALIDDKLPELDPEENDQAMLDASLKWITKWGVGFTVVMIFIWPLLSLPAGCGDGTCGVFSEGYFTLWVSIALAWGLLATVVIIVLPLYESREVLGGVIKGVFTGAKASDSA